MPVLRKAASKKQPERFPAPADFYAVPDFYLLFKGIRKDPVFVSNYIATTISGALADSILRYLANGGNWDSLFRAEYQIYNRTGMFVFLTGRVGPERAVGNHVTLPVHA